MQVFICAHHQELGGRAAVAKVGVLAVQAHAWVALGKVCLTDEAIAKKCLPLFIQELGRATNPAVSSSSMPTGTQSAAFIGSLSAYRKTLLAIHSLSDSHLNTYVVAVLSVQAF